MKWLFCDPELTLSVEGMRRLCVQHKSLVAVLIREQFGWNQKQVRPALHKLIAQDSLAGLSINRESWALHQMCQHVRVSEQNSLDFSRLCPAMRELCALYRARKQGAAMALLPSGPSADAGVQ